MESFLQWVEWMDRFLRVGLFCNHSRTPASEGKCHCPDCGRGVVMQWVVLRCVGCNVRRDSRYMLRRLVPADRCCTHCGESGYRLDYLDSPAFYQLQKASLLVQEESEFLRRRFDWVGATVSPAAPPLAEKLLQSFSDTLSRARPWWPEPVCLPVPVRGL